MKKKKKTLYIRRIRKRSTNKSPRYSSFNFLNKFDDFFISKLIDSGNHLKSFLSIFKFLISFFSINEMVILNILKKFGACLNLKLNKNILKSGASYYLKSKFLNKNVLYTINFKNFVILKKLFFLKLKKTSFNTRLLRFNNVENKKKMTLYFSYRHLLSLPVRGQRTKTNAKIRKNYSII